MYDGYYYDDTLYSGILSGISIAYMLIVLAVGIIVLIATWKLFQKAGKPGWGSIIPFYNSYCLFDMVFGNGWLFLLCLVPCVNIVVGLVLNFKLAKSFGQGTAFGIGLIFLYPIFISILGFGNYDYVGPAN